jgi:rhamnulokinase
VATLPHTRNYLAIDLGAESGRGVLAAFDGERLSLRELRRFPTTRGEADRGPDGVRRWDFERLWAEIQATLAQAQAESGLLSGIGVDSWGVDFGLLDAKGRLLEAPVQYRDPSHTLAMQQALGIISREDLWAATGIQTLPFNTLYQLLARQARDPALLDHARRLLLIPDLIHARLTDGAAAVVEYTNATTTQCLDTATRQWNHELLARLGLPSHYLGPLVEAGHRLGATPDGVPVYAPGTHDTASAVAAVPSVGETNWAFLSSGTWSLLGAERPAPVRTPEALNAGFSNEGGVGGVTRFLQNIMGLWMVQECRRSLLRREGRDYAYADLADLAAAIPQGGPVVDATDQRFLAPADMTAEIAQACAESGTPLSTGVGPLIRCCLDSLALAYRRGLRDMQTILGNRFDTLHIVGGGAQNRLLNQLTADACGLPVIAGPGEATALGNVLGQLVGSGAVADWAQAREVSRRSSPTETFLPDPLAAAQWTDLSEGSR